MKITDAYLITKVPDGGPGATTEMLRSVNGWEITADFDKGILFVKKGPHQGIVPMTNVRFMVAGQDSPVAVASKGKAA